MTVLLKDLKKTFADGTEAVKHVDLEIRQGEFITLLGPSGLSLIHISEPTRPY